MATALILLSFLAVLALAADASAAPSPLGFTVKLDVARQELHPDWCWFHPRAAAMPGHGRAGGPAVVMTLQKHLKTSDHYSGLYFMRSDDRGQTWTDPVLPPELDWRRDRDVDVAVADCTPGWHALTGRLLVIGTKVRYRATGEQLYDVPGCHQLSYTTYDPATGRWTPWQELATPEMAGKFYLVAPGCVQWLVKADGTLLVPVYFKGPTGSDYASTVLHLGFDGHTLTYLDHGDELGLTGGRGLYEPSLAKYRGKYYLTLRNDARGYVTTGPDGLHWGPVQPWAWDGGGELGSYNTQQHWLVHHDGLFLCYTRRGANNDDIPRHRAPLFLAQVDPQKLQVLRATEQVLMPERGVMLGNFGANLLDENESWVTDAEYMFGAAPHPRGADNSVFVARVRWSEPNRLARPVKIVCLGDSITKGARPGVPPGQTFAARLEQALAAEGWPVEVVNVGIGGERTDQALARLAGAVIALQPALVTIMYGTNDSYVDVGKTASRLTVEAYVTNLRRLVQELRAAGAETVLMTAPRWGDQAHNGLGENPNVRLEAYLAAERQAAAELAVPLIDHYAAWTAARDQGTDLGDWTTDQCHPNPTGHQVLAETMLPVLRRLVAQRLSAPAP